MVAYYQRAASDTGVRFGGHMAHISATAWWCISAIQKRTENDAEAAVRAGLVS